MFLRGKPQRLRPKGPFGCNADEQAAKASESTFLILQQEWGRSQNVEERFSEFVGIGPAIREGG
jgi:hypothetical protein